MVPSMAPRFVHLMVRLANFVLPKYSVVIHPLCLSLSFSLCVLAGSLCDDLSVPVWLLSVQA